MNAILAPPTVDTYPGAQAVSRAVALLKAFTDGRPEWGVSELSDRVGLNRTTTHRLLAALESEGLVMRSPSSGGYRLGAEMIALGGLALRSHPLRSVARPVLEGLVQATGENAALEILSEGQMLVLDEIVRHDLMSVSQDVGSRLPVHATSTGKMMLAYQPEEIVARLLSPPLAGYTPHTRVDLELLCQELVRIREQGYAVNDGELDVGFVAVAAPVFDASRAVVAAISVGGPSVRLNVKRLPEVVASVQVAARQISRRLGYRPGQEVQVGTQYAPALRTQPITGGEG